MKKAISLILCLAVMLLCSLPFTAMASQNADAPSLESISFNNATLDRKFNPNHFDYTISLENPELTPTLKAYKIKGSANIFVTYSVDETKHQDGIVVKIEHTNGAVYYNFKYSNAVSYGKSSNNLLKEVHCSIGEVYPEINEQDTDYKLYVPSDITEITLSAATQELSAFAEIPSTITLSMEQEPVIPITVTASNGETRAYSFKVKRLNKTTEEVLKEMAKPDFKSIVYGELFYQKPEFAVGIISLAGGIIFLAVAIFVAKRIMIKVGDDDETDFFSSINSEE